MMLKANSKNFKFRFWLREQNCFQVRHNSNLWQSRKLRCSWARCNHLNRLRLQSIESAVSEACWYTWRVRWDCYPLPLRMVPIWLRKTWPWQKAWQEIAKPQGNSWKRTIKELLDISREPGDSKHKALYSNEIIIFYKANNTLRTRKHLHKKTKLKTKSKNTQLAIRPATILSLFLVVSAIHCLAVGYLTAGWFTT